MTVTILEAESRGLLQGYFHVAMRMYGTGMRISSVGERYWRGSALAGEGEERGGERRKVKILWEG